MGRCLPVRPIDLLSVRASLSSHYAAVRRVQEHQRKAPRSDERNTIEMVREEEWCTNGRRWTTLRPL